MILKTLKTPKAKLYLSSIFLGSLMFFAMAGRASAAADAIDTLKTGADKIDDIATSVTVCAAGSVAFAGGAKIFKRIAFS